MGSNRSILTPACLAACTLPRTWHCFIPRAGLVEGDAKLEGGAGLHQCFVQVLNCLDEVGCSKGLGAGRSGAGTWRGGCVQLSCERLDNTSTACRGCNGLAEVG